jgi:hypothetical protein
LSKVEKGATYVGLEIIGKLAAVLEIEPAELLKLPPKRARRRKEPKTTQKDAAWDVLEEAYMAVSNGGALPALARQIYYQARPKIMAMTDNKHLAYGYFSQTLLPDYVEGGLSRCLR